MKSIAIKYSLFVIIIGLLWSPLLVKQFKFIDEKPLKGYFMPPDTSYLLNDTNWLKGDFQSKYETWFNYTMGLHLAGVRLANQFNYWVNEPFPNIIIGKNNNLMETAYIDSYLGKDFVGKDSIDNECRRILQLQSLLKKRGIDFFVVVAPNKSRIYSEDIPAFYQTEARKRGNYEFYSEGFKKYGIHHLDVHKWFEQAMDTSRYPLFSNLGVHWSIYGGMLFTDSLLKYTEHLTGRKLNKLKLGAVHLTNTADATDDDLLQTMNLMFPVKPNEPFAYIDREPIIDSANQRPRLLAVGDSYWWTIMNFGVPRIFFADSSAYFYYNATAFFNSGPERAVGELNSGQIVRSSEVVLLIYTEPNLKHTWNSFIENTLSALADSTKEK